tara:strand:+ start:251 stop:505 length:255 start_codon:yes stop_codon:yes gene_type:complete
MIDNFYNIPSEGVKLQVRRLINTLHANAGLYDSDEVAAALYALRHGVQLKGLEEMRKSSQEFGDPLLTLEQQAQQARKGEESHD